ncbi:hypothetical protein ACFQ1I_30615 [Kitasatospora arboriphila]
MGGAVGAGGRGGADGALDAEEGAKGAPGAGFGSVAERRCCRLWWPGNGHRALLPSVGRCCWAGRPRACSFAVCAAALPVRGSRSTGAGLSRTDSGAAGSGRCSARTDALGSARTGGAVRFDSVQGLRADDAARAPMMNVLHVPQVTPTGAAAMARRRGATARPTASPPSTLPGPTADCGAATSMALPVGSRPPPGYGAIRRRPYPEHG